MFDRPHLYILDASGQPQPINDVLEWGRWMETANRVIAHDRNEGDGPGGTFVSTVFLGLDHNYSMVGPPLLYESMVFGGVLDGTTQRYATAVEAMAGHQALCRKVMETER